MHLFENGGRAYAPPPVLLERTETICEPFSK
nr:MAG TPA: hypothetical protein [Caudoviricetes sp.]